MPRSLILGACSKAIEQAPNDPGAMGFLDRLTITPKAAARVTRPARRGMLPLSVMVCRT